MIRNGANVNAANNNGNTALYVAALQGKIYRASVQVTEEKCNRFNRILIHFDCTILLI